MALLATDKIREPVWKNIPDEMKKYNRWLCWKAVPDKKEPEKMNKVPVDLNGQFLYEWQKRELFSFSEVKQAVKAGFAVGIGFSQGGTPYQCVDLDNAKGIEFISEELQSITNAGYAERSPSGRGLHVWVIGNVPSDIGRKRKTTNGEEIEFFTNTGWVTVSGDRYNDLEPQERQNLIDSIIEKYNFKKEKLKPQPGAVNYEPNNLNEAEIIRAMNQSKAGSKISSLMRGDISDYNDDWSSADQALANYLAFFSKKDYGMMDAIFRQSGLYREKWDKKHRSDGATYGQITLGKAIADTTNVYDPKKKDSYFISVPGLTAKENESQKMKYYSWDDTGNADRFYDMFGENTLYSFRNKSFYNYTGKYWERDEMGSIRKKIDKVMDAIKNEPVSVPEGATEKEIKACMEAKTKFVKKIRSTKTKGALEKEIQHRIPVNIEKFDTDLNALNCQNGWIDLRTGELNHHDSKKLFSKIASVSYFPNESPDLWIKFLNRIFSSDPDLIHFFQVLMGYTLLGGNPEQILVLLYGNKGNNGKSVILSVLESILGDYKTNIPAEDLMQKKDKTGGHNDTIAKTVGARLVTSSEPDKGYRLSEGNIKRMTGNDTVTASFKGEKSFDFIPQHVLWLACNYIPMMNAGATDNSIWRRVVIVPFEVSIPKEERDKKLVDKLKLEKNAIFSWMIEGLKMYQKEGLEIPSKVENATNAERQSMDEIGEFVESELIATPNGKIITGEVHELYVLWNKAHGGRYPMTNTALTQELKARGFLIKRTNKGNTLYGFTRYHQSTKNTKARNF